MQPPYDTPTTQKNVVAFFKKHVLKPYDNREAECDKIDLNRDDCILGFQDMFLPQFSKVNSLYSRWDLHECALRLMIMINAGMIHISIFAYCCSFSDIQLIDF